MTSKLYQQFDKNTVATMDFKDASGQVFTMDLQQELSFSEHTFNQDLMNQASRYAWWSSVYIHAKQFLESARLNLEKVSAEVAIHQRSTLEAQGKKFTKDVVTDYVSTSAEYLEARNILMFWDARVNSLNFILKAFDQRNTSLTQFGAQYRRELDSQNNRTPLH